MTSAGKWVLGLLLLVVGAVFIARTVSSDPGSSATVKNNLGNAASASAAKDAKDQAAVEAAAKKKIASTIAGDVSCKKACIEVNEVAADSITTAKLAAGSVTLSKLAFEVPNLNELENEINARKVAEASVKAAQSEAAAAGAKNDAAITAAASNGITAESAARTAADEELAKKTAAADADLLSKLNGEVKDRGDADNVLQGKLNNEIADRAGAITNLRSELGNGNEVASPIIQINNNEIVNSSVTSNKIKDDTVTAEDLANSAVIGRGIAADLPLTNVKERTLRGERTNNSSAALSPGDIALGTITGNQAPNALGSSANGNLALETVTGEGDNTLRAAGAAVGNLGLKTVGRNNLVNKAVDNTKLETNAITTDKILDSEVKTDDIADGAVTFSKLDGATQTRINNLETGLAAEIVNRTAAVAAEALARTTADGLLQDAITAEALARSTADTAQQTALNAEITARTNADNALTASVGAVATNLATEITNRGTAEAALTSSINTVVANLATEVTNRTTGDATNATNLATETTNRTTADTALNTRIDDLTFADIDGVITASQLGTGSVVGGAGGAILDGSITAADLAGEDDDQDLVTPGPQGIVAGAVNTEKILDLTVQARDLAPDSVDSTKIGNGQIGTTELADAAVTSDKILASVAASSVPPALLTLNAGTPTGSPATATLPLTAGAHKVIVAGQVVATCACTAPGDSAVITWRGTDSLPALGQVGPLMSIKLTTSSPSAVLPVNGLASYLPAAVAGNHVYAIEVTAALTGATGVDLTGAGITATDLGR